MKSVAEASEAVKMAGLPVFFMGLMAIAYAAVQSLAVQQAVVDGGAYGLWQPLAIGAVGGGLIGLGLGLRWGRAALALPAFLITLANLGFAARMLPLGALFVAMLMVLLAGNGLRGWLWLRGNPTTKDQV